MGKPKDPDYWRKYRARNPEYRAREKARMAARVNKSHGDRQAQNARRRERYHRERGNNGPPATQAHPIMDQAAQVAQAYVKPDRRTHYLDPLYEEALMTAALAILAGDDPHAATQAVVRAERNHRAHQAPLLEDIA